jgi:hypothetical protein
MDDRLASPVSSKLRTGRNLIGEFLIWAQELRTGRRLMVGATARPQAAQGENSSSSPAQV